MPQCVQITFLVDRGDVINGLVTRDMAWDQLEIMRRRLVELGFRCFIYSTKTVLISLSSTLELCLEKAEGEVIDLERKHKALRRDYATLQARVNGGVQASGFGRKLQDSGKNGGGDKKGAVM